MIRLCFLIRMLNDGGAQRQLVELVRGLDRARFDVTVMTFYAGGRFWEEMRRVPGVRLISLDKTGRWHVFRFLWRLFREVRRLRPHLLHGYLGGANILAVLLKPFVPGMRAVWGIRAAYMDLARYDWLERATFGVQRRLARFADLIIVNSQAGWEWHRRLGFPVERMTVIPNGIDTEHFQPDGEARRRVRAEWGIAEGELVIGVVGRLDPMKDHPNFIRAAAILAEERSDLRFVCVGDGPTPYREELQGLAGRLGLLERLIWAGARSDMSAVYNALDVLCSSSYGEGFPNVVGEAMACGVPCVVTDAGDSAWIVGDVGIVVPPCDPAALAGGLRAVLSRPTEQRRVLGAAGRERIVRQFGRTMLAETTMEALNALLEG